MWMKLTADSFSTFKKARLTEKLKQAKASIVIYDEAE